MNNFGMNPMGVGMNPSLMNNMNNIGMNNQPNLMDNTALNIKNIIQPYENKIRELEEIIKKKDFEIIVLKQKLENNSIQINNLNNNMNMMNPMMNMNMINPTMNMNMMNPIMNMNMMNPFDMEHDNKKNEISINIESNIKNVKCFKNEKESTLKDRLILTYNYKPLCGRTLEENGIENGSFIGITDDIYNLRFRTTKGLHTNLSLGRNCPVKQAIKLYCESFKGKNIYQLALNKYITFIYNGFKINIQDEKSLKELFYDNSNPCIFVNEALPLIGG